MTGTYLGFDYNHVVLPDYVGVQASPVVIAETDSLQSTVSPPGTTWVATGQATVNGKATIVMAYRRPPSSVSLLYNTADLAKINRVAVEAEKLGSTLTSISITPDDAEQQATLLGFDDTTGPPLSPIVIAEGDSVPQGKAKVCDGRAWVSVFDATGAWTGDSTVTQVIGYR